MSPNTSKIALMIDVDCISSKGIELILEKANAKGKVLLYFASGKEAALKGWTTTIEEYRFRVVTAYDGKHVADRIIFKECIDISLERPEIDTFCIVTNDVRFARRLRNLLPSWGKKVFVIRTAPATKSRKAQKTITNN